MDGLLHWIQRTVAENSGIWMWDQVLLCHPASVNQRCSLLTALSSEMVWACSVLIRQRRCSGQTITSG
ncbi:hypothetical protein EK904_013549, partial [Melospiza melodia maxima]